MDASTSTSSAVEPHTTSVVVWDVPSAIVAGERFAIKVGIKCSGACPLTNRDFGVYDHEGARIATRTLSDDCWPGTVGLHVADVELEAPADEGLYTWSVKTTSAPDPKSDVGVPHAEGRTSFGVRVVGHPECVVTVEAVDRVSQAPVAGAQVVMHPYRAVTDDHGIAEVRAAKGEYTLFVSRTGYLTFGEAVDARADLSARVELDVEPVPERN